MDIISSEVLDARLLDAVARAALGKATCGVSVGTDSRIHLLAMNMPEQQRASDVLMHFGLLRLTASAERLKAGGADPVIRCRDALIAADERLGFLVLRAGEALMKGTLDILNGECSLTLPQPNAAQYKVFFYRIRGSYDSGAVEIRVERA